MKILNMHPMFNPDQIKQIEKHYNAKFVCETCLKSSSGGWINSPFAVFYTETAHPEGSNWFGLYYNHEGYLMITDAKSALEPFEGLLFEDGSVFYSRYRHDYQTLKDGTMVDGGRDYFRCTLNSGRPVLLKIMKDQLGITECR